MSENCEMCGVELPNNIVGRDHDTYDCATNLRNKLSASEAEVAKLMQKVKILNKELNRSKVPLLGIFENIC